MNILAHPRHPPDHSDVPIEGWGAPSSVTWERPPARPHIAEDEVHVWAAGLGSDEASLGAYRDTLSDGESTRAERFLALRDRNRYVMSRGILRKILSIYIGMTPGEVPLSADRWGKPLLTSRDGAPPVHFNMSHSVDVLLVAVARGSQVGVDVEWIDPALDWAPIADFVLSRSDVRAIRNVPEVHRRAAFYSLWTQWEALSKAIGCGLSLPRTSAVSVGRLGNWAGHQHDNWEGPEGGQWRTRILTPRYGYVAALAVAPSSAANMKFHYVGRPPWEALVKPIGEERSPTPPAGDPDER